MENTIIEIVLNNMNNTAKIIEESLKELKEQYEKVDEIALYNQEKVLKAFQKYHVASRHFSGTNGYGYDDIGRDTLCKIYADAFEAETAIVSPNIVSGTHALTLALFGVLRPNDLLLSITGNVYDTLNDVITGGNGSLADFNVEYDKIPLINDKIDYDKVKSVIQTKHPKMVFIQRSRGYDWRQALSIDEISKAISFVKGISKDIIVMVDNCYGEFINIHEPTYFGADIIVGSLIKNPGGGIAPTGGYIAGNSKVIDLIAGRLTSPSIGMEVGSYMYGYVQFYQGFFLAPHITAQAIKTSMLFACCLSKLGYETLPKPNEDFSDIICAIKIGDKDKLVTLCQTIQSISPVDSYLLPEPWAMPGYEDEVIMAAGCFVAGSSIELSSDAPLREPYILYIQGGLTFEHGKIAVKKCLEALLGLNNSK